MASSEQNNSDSMAYAALSEISTALTVLQPLPALAQNIIAVLERHLRYEFAAVLLIDDDGLLAPIALSDQGKGKAFIEHDKRYVRGHHISLGVGITGWVAQTGCSVRSGDVRENPHYYGIRDSIRSELCVPIRTGQQILGVLNIETTRLNAYSSRDQEILAAIAAQLGIAIQNIRLMETLRQHNTDLEQRVAARTAELSTLNQQLVHEIAERKHAEAILREQTAELKIRNRDLDAFAQTVAHDLKNPLAGGLAYAYVLLESLPESGASPEWIQSAQSQVTMILDYAGRMERLISALLVFASIRDAEAAVSEVKMGPVVRSVLDGLSTLDNAQNMPITTPETWPCVMGYEPWLEIVWTNLITNAIKYAGAHAQIDLGYTRQGAEVVRFWVRDNGPGLDADKREQIFSPFVRFHTDEIPGSGLGLSIVKRIIERLNGEVAVESDIGVGSTFSFTLPGVPQR